MRCALSRIAAGRRHRTEWSARPLRPRAHRRPTASAFGWRRKRPVPTSRAHLSSDARYPQQRHRALLIGMGARQRIAVAVHRRLLLVPFNLDTANDRDSTRRAEAFGGAHLATVDRWAPAARSVNRSSRGCCGGYLMLNMRCAREGFQGIEIPARRLVVRRRASANGWQIGPASGLCWHRGEDGPHQFVRQGGWHAPRPAQPVVSQFVAMRLRVRLPA